MLDAAIQRRISVAESLDDRFAAFPVWLTSQHRIHFGRPIYSAVFLAVLCLIFPHPLVTNLAGLSFTVLATRLYLELYLGLLPFEPQSPLQISEPQACPFPPFRTSDTEVEPPPEYDQVEPLPAYDQVEPGPPGFEELFYLDCDAEFWPFVWRRRRRNTNAQYRNIYYEQWQL